MYCGRNSLAALPGHPRLMLQQSDGFSKAEIQEIKAGHFIVDRPLLRWDFRKKGSFYIRDKWVGKPSCPKAESRREM